ncbi:hypothetical protein Tco_0251474 [Tanacetum coccineum]
MLNNSKAEHMGVLKDVMCQVGVITIIAKFLILYMPIDKDAPILVGRGFLYTCGSILNTRDRITSTFDRVCHQTFRVAKSSLNTEESDSDDEEDYGSTKSVQKICVRKKAIGFLGSLLVPLQHMEWKPDYEVNFGKKEEGDGQWHAEIRLTDPYRNVYDQDWNVLNTLSCGNVIEDMLEVRVNEMGSNEFDKVVADDELITKKAIKFRLCGKAYAMSILDFAKRLGLYTGAEIQEYGFETYYIRGLRNDDDFSADQYWLNISSEETLTLSKSSAKTIRKPVLKVLQKMITYGQSPQNGYANLTWLIAKWMNKKGVGTKRESLIYCGQFVTRITKRLGILSNEVLNGLSAPTYYRTLDANILRELIGSNRRLIPEEIAPRIPRVATPRAPRPTTSDLYDKISQLETRIGEIERMTRMQSYHSDLYARVLEHIALHFRVTLRDPYNPPNYFE